MWRSRRLIPRICCFDECGQGSWRRHQRDSPAPCRGSRARPSRIPLAIRPSRKRRQLGSMPSSSLMLRRNRWWLCRNHLRRRQAGPRTTSKTWASGLTLSWPTRLPEPLLEGGCSVRLKQASLLEPRHCTRTVEICERVQGIDDDQLVLPLSRWWHARRYLPPARCECARGTRWTR